MKTTKIHQILSLKIRGRCMWALAIGFLLILAPPLEFSSDIIKARSSSVTWIRKGSNADAGVLFILSTDEAEVQAYKDRYSSHGGRLEYYGIELMRAIQSVRDNSPKIPIASLFSPSVGSKFLNCTADWIGLVDQKFEFAYSSKIAFLSLSPFSKTIFLDLDCFVCHHLTHVFSFLNAYDILLADEPNIVGAMPNEYKMSVNWTFNSGVIGYRRTKTVNKFFYQWLVNHEQRNKLYATNSSGDQHSLQHSVPSSSLHFFRMSHEFNLRCNSNVSPFLLRGHVFVIHSRSVAKRLGNQACKLLNQNSGHPRVLMPSNFTLIDLY